MYVVMDEMNFFNEKSTASDDWVISCVRVSVYSVGIIIIFITFLFLMHKSNFLLILLASSMFRNRLNRIGWKNFIQWLSCVAANRNCMRTLHSSLLGGIGVGYYSLPLLLLLLQLLTAVCVCASTANESNQTIHVIHIGNSRKSSSGGDGVLYSMLYNIS